MEFSWSCPLCVPPRHQGMPLTFWDLEVVEDKQLLHNFSSTQMVESETTNMESSRAEAGGQYLCATICIIVYSSWQPWNIFNILTHMAQFDASGWLHPAALSISHDLAHSFIIIIFGGQHYHLVLLHPWTWQLVGPELLWRQTNCSVGASFP